MRRKNIFRSYQSLGERYDRSGKYSKHCNLRVLDVYGHHIGHSEFSLDGRPDLKNVWNVDFIPAMPIDTSAS